VAAGDLSGVAATGGVHSPDCQRLTLRALRRTHLIIDSHGSVLSSVRFSEARMPRLVVARGAAGA
jgi:hypothetical protein